MDENSAFISDQSIRQGRCGNANNAYYNAQLSEENLMLKEENESLKSQLSRVEQELMPELQNLHLKNRDLTSQLLEINKRSDNFQNRLKLSQMKCQELESKLIEGDSRYTQLQSEHELISSKCSDQQHNSNLLVKEISTLKKKNEELKSSIDQFFGQFSKLSGTNITSFANVTTQYVKLREEKQEVKVIHEPPPIVDNNSNEIIIQKLREKKDSYKEIILQLQNQNQTLTSQLNSKARGYQQLRDSESRKSEIQTSRLQETLDQLQAEKEAHVDTENKINLLKQEIEKLRKDISKKDSQITNLSQQLIKNEDFEKVKNDLALKCRNETDLNNQIASLKKVMSQVQESASKNLIKLNSSVKTKKHLKARLTKTETEFKAKLADAYKKISALDFALQSIEEDRKSLLTQLQAAKASHAEANSAFNSVKNDSQQVEKALMLIRPLVEKQKSEIETLSSENKRFICLIRKQAQIISKLDQLLTEEMNNTKSLSTQVKRLEKVKKNKEDNEQVVEQKLLALINTNLIQKLNGEIRDLAVPIVLSQTAPPINRISSVFKLIVDKLSELKNQNLLNQLHENSKNDFEYDNKIEKEKIEREKAEKAKLANDKAQSVLQATISSFHKILNNSKQYMSFDQNSELISFISQKTSQLENLMKENEFIDPQFISTDFLFTGSIETRKAAIYAIKDDGWNANDTFSLFCVMALTNIAQENSLKKLATISDELKQIQTTLKCKNANEVISVVKNLAKKLKKIQTQNKSLLTEIQNSSVIIPQNEELQAELMARQADISSIQEEYYGLQKENESLKKHISSLEQNKSDLQREQLLQKQSYEDEIEQYDKKINEKVKECQCLSTKLNFSSSTIDTLKKSINEKDSFYQGRIDDLENKNASYEQHHKAKVKQLKLKVRQLEQKYQNDINALTQSQKAAELKYIETVNNVKKQNDENEILVKRMANSLEKSEKRNQKMLNDIASLNIANKSLEMKIEALMDEMKREEQMLNAKFEFKLMANETKHQEEIAKTKIKYLTERDQVMIHVLHCFDELDQFECDDINVPEYELAVSKIGGEFKKLKQIKK